MKRVCANLKRLGEFGLIGMIRQRVRKDRSVLVGIGDDAAVIRVPGKSATLFTTDMLIQGRHFLLPRAKPYWIGWKAMAVNLSDIAAMGGVPRQAVVSVGLPMRLSPGFMKELIRGIEAAARKFGAVVVGGDTNRSDNLVVNVALLGTAPRRGAVLRSGARPGDILFVTGSLGGSLRSGKHLTFTPRCRESAYLMSRYRVNAMIDLSDGLASDIHRIADESRCGAVLIEANIPLAPGVKRIENALQDGEDFELLFALSPSEARRLAAARKPRGLARMRAIGWIASADCGVQMVGRNGRWKPIAAAGFDHFKRS